MKLIYYQGAFIGLLLTVACASSNEFPGDYKGDQIHFGQGGGLAGILNYHILLENGNLYHRSFSDSTFTLVSKWDDAFVTQMFSNYESLHLDTIDMYEPGDQYYFIQYQSHNKPMHRIAWGKPGVKANQNLVTYYNLLYKSTKTKS